MSILLQTMSTEECSSVGDFSGDFEGQDPGPVAVGYPYSQAIPIR